MIAEILAKKDNAELVRDKLAEILITESTIPAVAPDPSTPTLKVYGERSNPWSDFQDDPTQLPIVNIILDNVNYHERSSDLMSKQNATATYRIEVVASAVSESTSTGHKAGDYEASIACQKAARIVRNILMSAKYTYLAERGKIHKRWISSINFLEPASESTVQQLKACIITLLVDYTDVSPQYEGLPLESISVNVKQADTGLYYITATYQD